MAASLAAAPPGAGPGASCLPASNQRRCGFRRPLAAGVRPLVRSAGRQCPGIGRGGAQSHPDAGRPRRLGTSHRHAVRGGGAPGASVGVGSQWRHGHGACRVSRRQSNWAKRQETCSGPPGLCTGWRGWAGPARCSMKWQPWRQGWTASSPLPASPTRQPPPPRTVGRSPRRPPGSRNWVRSSTRPRPWVKQPSTSGANGSNRDAAAMQQAAGRLLARCEGAVTPFVRAVGARAQLTPAELDTALQAATGSTDKQIAEVMHLSVRTVENRLHRAYQKLGLSHRRELAEALRDLPGSDLHRLTGRDHPNGRGETAPSG